MEKKTIKVRVRNKRGYRISFYTGIGCMHCKRPGQKSCEKCCAIVQYYFPNSCAVPKKFFRDINIKWSILKKPRILK